MEEFYPLKRDQELYKKLDNLFTQWKKDIGFPKHKSDVWNSDGIFPGYTSAKFKILFVGRENRTDYDYAQNLGKFDNNLIFLKLSEWDNEGNKNHFRSRFYPRILEITRKINNHDAPNEYTTNEYLDYLREKHRLDFAFMEISKYANIKADGDKVNKKMVDSFLTDKSIENTQKEIEIINPDLIITMNLWSSDLGIKDKMNKIFGIANPEKGKLCTAKIGKQEFKLMNLYHFSAYNRKNEDFIKPVYNAYKKLSEK